MTSQECFESDAFWARVTQAAQAALEEVVSSDHPDRGQLLAFAGACRRAAGLPKR